jgi:hypothetical protein
MTITRSLAQSMTSDEKMASCGGILSFMQLLQLHGLRPFSRRNLVSTPQKVESGTDCQDRLKAIE